MISVFDGAILGCSILGLLISLYFTLVYYRVIQPDVRFIPSFCRLDEATCQFLMSTRNAQILGVRNFVLGLLYYAALIIYVTLDDVQKVVPGILVSVISFLTILVGIYLAYGLLVKLKTHCMLCYTSHACNLLIFIALVVRPVE